MSEGAQYYNHLRELADCELVGEHAYCLFRGRLPFSDIDFWGPRHDLCDELISERHIWHLVPDEDEDDQVCA